MSNKPSKIYSKYQSSLQNSDTATKWCTVSTVLSAGGNWGTLALLYLTMQCTLKLHPSLSLALGSSNCSVLRFLLFYFLSFKFYYYKLGGKYSHTWSALSGSTVHLLICKNAADGLACAVYLPTTFELCRLSSGEMVPFRGKYQLIIEVFTLSPSHPLPQLPISRQPLMVFPSSLEEQSRWEQICTFFHVAKIECK